MEDVGRTTHLDAPRSRDRLPQRRVDLLPHQEGIDDLKQHVASHQELYPVPIVSRREPHGRTLHSPRRGHRSAAAKSGAQQTRRGLVPL